MIQEKNWNNIIVTNKITLVDIGVTRKTIVVYVYTIYEHIQKENVN